MDELSLAEELADIGAEIALRYFSRDPEISTKDDGTLVTIADRSIEEAVRERIGQRFPSHAVLGEESGLVGEPGAPLWIIDPIDGTNNFAWGIPIFATLIAFNVDGAGVIGVASAPALGERYVAAKGGGATMNGQPIRVSEVSTLEQARFLYSSHSGWTKRGPGEKWWALVDRGRRDRGLGDFWGHMLVARGAAEAMAEPSLAVWDVAALEVIVEEAGGRMTGFGGKPYPSPHSAPGGETSCLSTNGVLHDEIVAALTDANA